jgi:hypothetical protein
VNLNLGEDYKVAYNNHVHHNVRGGGTPGETIDSHGLHSNSFVTASRPYDEAAPIRVRGFYKSWVRD